MTVILRTARLFKPQGLKSYVQLGSIVDHLWIVSTSNCHIPLRRRKHITDGVWYRIWCNMARAQPEAGLRNLREPPCLVDCRYRLLQCETHLWGGLRLVMQQGCSPPGLRTDTPIGWSGMRETRRYVYTTIAYSIRVVRVTPNSNAQALGYCRGAGVSIQIQASTYAQCRGMSVYAGSLAIVSAHYYRVRIRPDRVEVRS